MNRFAFSKPTSSADDTRLLFTRFREIGYEGLQLKTGQYLPYLDEPQRFLDEWGRYPGAASALIFGGNLDEENTSRLRKVFEFGGAVGSEIVIFCHGAPREGLTDDDIRAHARRLSELGREARDRGPRLSLHNHFNNPVMGREDIAVFFDAVEDGAVGLTLDTAHLVKSGVDDVAGTIRESAHTIDNFHLKDIRDGQFEVLGRGEIDFAPVFASIAAIAYTGWISTDEESGADLLDAMAHCLSFMREGVS